MLAPALWAQKAAGDDTPAESKAAPPEPAKAPAAQPAKPAPAPAKASDPHILPGSDYPHWEWFMGYSYVNGRVGSGVNAYNANGGSTNIEYNLNHWIGLVADLGGYNVGKVGGVNVNANEFSYLFGPRLNYRFGQGSRHTVFGQILVGGSHVNADLFSGTTTVASASNNAFAMTSGGGLDLGLTKHLALRLAQVEYYLTDYDFKNGYRPQNNFRFSTGIVFRWGAKPQFVNKPPTASCSTDVSSIMQGSGESVPVRANASDPDGDTLTYAWSANGGRVEGTGPVARWSPGDAAPGSYTVTARVDDGHGGTTSCSSNVSVESRPLRPPTVSCSVDRSTVQPGDRVNVTATGRSPEGFPLNYTWRSSGGQVTGSGSRVQLNTTGLTAGNYTVTARASDGHGGVADCSASVNVSPPAAVEARLAIRSIYFPTALPTTGKPDVGLVASQEKTLSSLAGDFKEYLKSKPDAHLVLEGHADPRGTKEYNQKLSERRVEITKRYLVGLGIPESSLQTKAFGEEENLTEDQVKQLVEQHPNLTQEQRDKILGNLQTVTLAQNRRVDITLSSTGQQSVRQFPFNAEDSLTLLSRKAGGEKEKPAAKKKP